MFTGENEDRLRVRQSVEGISLTCEQEAVGCWAVLGKLPGCLTRPGLPRGKISTSKTAQTRRIDSSNCVSGHTQGALSDAGKGKSR
jgi:hypothetical protein